ncbi:fimbrial protein, partial [Escherichia coli]|uniref:fimbrial protein n=1 Tax=Escherichia coli TaxID=562 RepID=UPI00374D073B
NVTVDTPVCRLHLDNNVVYLGDMTSHDLKENRTPYTGFMIYFTDCNNTSTGKIYFTGENLKEDYDGSMYLENKFCQSCAEGVRLKLFDNTKTPLKGESVEISLTDIVNSFAGYVRPTSSDNEKITAGLIDTSVRVVVQYN